MKIRNGFVSNSSSSSFVCEVCGYSEAYNNEMSSRSDFGVQECENGHIICLKHIKDGDKLDKYDDIAEEDCPICNFSSVSKSDFLMYYLKKNNISKYELAAIIKEEFFGSYKQFKYFLKNKT